MITTTPCFLPFLINNNTPLDALVFFLFSSVALIFPSSKPLRAFFPISDEPHTLHPLPRHNYFRPMLLTHPKVCSLLLVIRAFFLLFPPSYLLTSIPFYLLFSLDEIFSRRASIF